MDDDKSVTTEHVNFLDTLASKSPTPGGGGAASYTGALAAALASMVCNLTIGKKKYKAVEDQIIMALDDLTAIRSQLVNLIEADAQAFKPLAKCYAMPHETAIQQNERNCAMQKALINAIEVPLEIMSTSLEVLDECMFLAENGNKLAISDVGCAVALAHAAVHAASLNVIINLKSLEDKERALSYQSNLDQLCNAADKRYETLFPAVIKQIVD